MIASARPPAPTTTAQGARSGHSSTIVAHHHPAAARQQARTAAPFSSFPLPSPEPKSSGRERRRSLYIQET
jgi:hypothetical protein